MKNNNILTIYNGDYNNIFDCKNLGKIKDVKYTDETQILIFGEKKILQLDAAADCCSESWFEFLDCDIYNIISKEIINFENIGSINLPNSGRQEYDSNNEYRINFLDGEYFKFVLRNSSNGYYNGWIDFTVKEL